MTKLAIAGATGLVGRKMLETVDRKNISFDELVLFSSARSAGEKIEFQGKTYTVKELTEEAASEHYDYVLMSAGGSTSAHFSPIFEQAGAIVIDNSSQWRMADDIDLIVPEVNEPVWKRKIIANPNCSTIQSVVPLVKLHKELKIKRIVYSTYQAVSGSGVGGIKDLENGINGEENKKYPHQIAYNCLPHIDEFLDNGYTKEEMKMINETKKILNDEDIRITATTVRVPVKYGHSVCINLEFENTFEMDQIYKLLQETEGVNIIDDVKNNVYPMPIDIEGKDEVYVGRIRRDYSVENGINMWVVADNIRKGAATNAVQIAELLIKKLK